MKTRILFLSMGLLLPFLIFVTCKNDEFQESGDAREKIIVPPMNNSTDCAPETRGVIEHFSLTANQPDIFFVRGIVNGGPVEETGRNIKIIDDLKGNLADKMPVILWGNGGNNAHYNEFGEALRSYFHNDTLIILMKKDRWTDDNGIEREYFCTAGCDRSVLKYSKGNVMGAINNGFAGSGNYPAEILPWETFLGCLEVAGNPLKDKLTGDWVNTQQDTLSFTGYYLLYKPHIPSVYPLLYDYTVKDDSISMILTYSNDLNTRRSYYFQYSEELIEIHLFQDKEQSFFKRINYE
jgi:hypothetical protein